MGNDLEEKLGAILSDPQMMQKIQAMAQSLTRDPPPEASRNPPQIPNIDLSMVQQLAGLAGQTAYCAGGR